MAFRANLYSSELHQVVISPTCLFYFIIKCFFGLTIVVHFIYHSQAWQPIVELDGWEESPTHKTAAVDEMSVASGIYLEELSGVF